MLFVFIDQDGNTTQDKRVISKEFILEVFTTIYSRLYCYWCNISLCDGTRKVWTENDEA